LCQTGNDIYKKHNGNNRIILKSIPYLKLVNKYGYSLCNYYFGCGIERGIFYTEIRSGASEFRNRGKLFTFIGKIFEANAILARPSFNT